MKFIRILILTLLATVGLAQENSRWTDHLSYTNTSDLSIWGSKIVVAGEFGAFIYDREDNSLRKFSKVNGLLGEQITAIFALENEDAFVIGYITGNFSIIYSDSRILHIKDISNSSIPGGKSINTIAEYGDNIYLATSFGIVEYDFIKEEFGDSFYFGPNGAYIDVSDMAFKNNFIYAATTQGVFKADIEDPFLVDYNRWEIQDIATNYSSAFNSIAEINGFVVVNCSEGDDKQYVLREGDQWINESDYPSVKKIKSTGEYLTISYGNTARVLDKNLKLVESRSKSGLSAMSSLKINDETFIASSKEGLVKYADGDWSSIVPDGPKGNNAFRIKTSGKNLYIIYGYFDQFYTPRGRLMGYDIFDLKEWNYIEPSTFSNVKDLTQITIDPKDPKHLYFSSWRSGVLEMQDNERVELWVDKNTDNHIQKLFYAPDPNYVSIRIGGSVFDKQGNLWIANGWNVDRPFVVKKSNGEWNSFPLNEISTGNDDGMAEITIDDNGNKWIATRGDGIWIFNEGEDIDSSTDNKMLRFSTSENSGNLPDRRVNTVAIDKDNIAWIGTKLGLVVFNDIDEMYDLSYFSAEPIIIEEDGVGKKLLGNQTVNKIVVDGANNKWFATESGGVYYTSSNGQKTIYHFTEENSPLPSNQVLDLDVDPETGRVYFVTPKGLVSFLGTATEGGSSFSKVFAYPNPVQPNYDGDIYIKGLTDKTNVKITDINGNLIFETTSQGGQAVWNGRSLSGYKASSGVYLVFAVSKDGIDTTVTKILIVN